MQRSEAFEFWRLKPNKLLGFPFPTSYKLNYILGYILFGGYGFRKYFYGGTLCHMKTLIDIAKTWGSGGLMKIIFGPPVNGPGHR